MGKSCNVAFAKVALRWLDAGDLLRSAESLGFNNTINFEFPVQQSRIHVENNEKVLQRQQQVLEMLPSPLFMAP